jgi:hypothetical protein
MLHSSYLPAEIDALYAQINVKKEEYDVAMKDDREFKYIKKIYLEIKDLGLKIQSYYKGISHQ